MLKNMSIKLRLTILSVILLTACCVGLTAILNFSALRMADVIEAVPMTPANSTDPSSAIYREALHASDALPLTPVTIAARKDFSSQSILYMIIVVVIGGVLTYYISDKALTPLKELNVQMKNRTVHNLSESLPVPESHDEIADLTCSFNEMSSKLDDNFSMQKRFSQSAAHELRTPLTVLKTKVDVFNKKKDHTAEEYDKLLSVMTNQTNRLSDLVKDLLNLTNIDALECNEQIKLKGVVMEISEELSCLAKDKNLSVTICGQEQIILGDQSLLHRAFYNLFENAIKYNKDNGNVDISLSKGDGHSGNALVTIKDSGIGIQPELRELIFEPFFRVDKSRSRQMGGAGLGLSTVKAIIDKHHGKIKISDNPEGGTIFEIML